MHKPKKTNRTEYYRQQKKAYREKHRTVSVSFTKTVAQEIERDAERHHLSLPKYVKACVNAYRNQTFIIPDLSQVKAIELQLRGIGNNINQIARRVNDGRTLPRDGVEQVRQQLKHLEAQFDRIIRTPWNLETYLTLRIKDDPTIVTVLLKIVIQHLNADQENHPQDTV